MINYLNLKIEKWPCYRGKACLSANPDLHRKQFPARFEAAMLSKKHPIQFELV